LTPRLGLLASLRSREEKQRRGDRLWERLRRWQAAAGDTRLGLLASLRSREEKQRRGDRLWERLRRWQAAAGDTIT
jgi:Ni/Co efflux regulator RcnB